MSKQSPAYKIIYIRSEQNRLAGTPEGFTHKEETIMLLKRRAAGTVMAVMLAAAAALAGCSGDKANGDAGENKDVTIKVMSWHGEQGGSKFYEGYRAIADDYTAAHPNVKIEFIYQPQDGYQQLLDTQFIANSAPDVIHMQTRMYNEYANKGVLYNLNNALSGKSAYSDEASWFDTFVGGAASFGTARSGNQYGGIFFLPNDENPAINVGQPFAYNKTMFKELGIDPEDTPETWSEFIDICRKIKDAGKIPVAADNSRWVSWSLGDIAGQFGEKAVDQFFDEKYNDDPQGVYFADKQKIALANGDLKNLDYYDDILRIWRDYANYWQDGWTGTAYEEASNLFFMQEAAMQKIGSWDHAHYTETIGDTFEWGIFPVPYMDEKTSDKAIGKYKAPSGQQKYGFAVNKSVENDAAKEAAVLDFLQYLSSVDAQNKYCKIAQSYSPVKGVEIPAELQGYVMPVDKSTATQILGASFIDNGDGAIWSGYAQEFLTDKLDAATFKGKVGDLSQKAAKDYCMNLMKPDGYEKQLADAKAKLEQMKESNADASAIQAQEDTIENIRVREAMMKEYYREK